MLNFVCRDGSLQKSILARISDIFPCVACVDIPQEVNKVVFASKSRKFTQHSAEGCDAADGQRAVLQTVSQSAKRLDRVIRTVSQSCHVDLAECIADLRVLSVK